MNPQLNKKVKKYLDSYFKDTKANSPEHQEAVMLILKGALTDANFHSEAKQLGKYFPKASKKYIGTPMEGVIEDKGVDIAKMAKWDGHDIIDAFAFYLSMSIGGSFGNRLMSLKESIEESLVKEGEQLDEKNVPTNPSKWSYYKAQAKKKFDVYPSAYANGWAAKQYKKAGGGWKSESVNEGYGEFIKAKNLTDIVNLSKKKKNAVFYVTDDNNSRIGAFYLKNGKFAKATSANPNYDLQNSKTTLRDRSDVIYKYKVDESVNEGRVEKEVLQKISKFETLLGYITNDDQYKPLVSKVKREIDKLKKQIEKNESVVNEGKFDRDVEKLYDAKEFDKFIKRYKSKFDKKDYKQLLDYAKSLNNEERDFEREDFDDPFDEQNAEMQLDTSREDLRELILKSLNESVNEAASRTAMEIGGLTGMNKDAIQKFVDDNNLDIEKVYQFVKKGKLADRMKLVSAIAGKPNNPVQKKMVKQFGEGIIREAKVRLGKDSVNFKVLGDSKGLTLIAASGNDLDGLQDAIDNDVDVKGELRKTLEKQLKVPVEIDGGYDGAGFRFNIDFYSLAKKVK